MRVSEHACVCMRVCVHASVRSCECVFVCVHVDVCVLVST